MKKLIIAEKPELGRAIAETIPGEKNWEWENRSRKLHHNLGCRTCFKT